MHAEDSDLRLHLGCGPTIVPGWQNLDRSPSVLLARASALRRVLGKLTLLTPQQVEGFPEGAIHADLTRGLPYHPGTARYVYSSHMLEHISRWQALNLLTECHRALALGGVVRIAVPDLRAGAEAYLAGKKPEKDPSLTPADAFMKFLNPRTEIQAGWLKRFVWRNISGAQHQWMYDADSLCNLFAEAGFASFKEKAFRESEMPDLELLEHRPDSVFVEAVKS